MTRQDGHVPVLCDEVVAALSPAAGETMVDATFGAGGYARALLASAASRIYAIDRDPEALDLGRPLAEGSDGRLILIRGRFSEMEDLLARHGVRAVDGITFDVGVSSMQLDRPERGFSFSQDGPLDMRMSMAGESAADLVNTASEDDLARIFRRYGEERHARRIARAIVAARSEKPITRTGELAEIVSRCSGKAHGARRIHPATRVFQALRIVVNDELGELDRGLAAAERLLRPEGRLAVVAFHSLEDRLIKTFLAERSGSRPSVSRHRPPRPADDRAPSFRLPRKGAIKPSQSETEANPRARSARLRVAVRTGAPAWEAAA